MAIRVPRDRDGDFTPQLVKKGQRRLEGFDDKVLSLYARGVSMREIQGHLEELYGTDVSPELISAITDAVLDEVRSWQNRPLESHYPIVYLDALRVKIRDRGHIVSKSVYLAIGVTMEGQKEALGLWLANAEASKFWLQIITELRNRDIVDIFIACVDSPRVSPKPSPPSSPKPKCSSYRPNDPTFIGLCVLAGAPHHGGDLRAIYDAANEDAARMALNDFKDKWDGQYPTISASWERNCTAIVPFLAYPPMIRKVVYTTNAIEAAIRQVRKIIKTKGAFPNDDAAIKLIYLALRNAEKKWPHQAAQFLAPLAHLVNGVMTSSASSSISAMALSIWLRAILRTPSRTLSSLRFRW